MKHIVLGMPGYGKSEASAARAFWNATKPGTFKVTRHYQAGSLLACNFNQLWCLALNLEHTGDKVDYWVLQHDDVTPLAVGPDEYWLNIAIEELEANNLDVLGAAIPIKDNRGITSLATHREGDNWMPLSRLSMHDIYELPETFTSEDIGQPLLLNTGCLIVKWNQEWCKQLHFEINDRIVFNRSANRFQAQTEPEDWYFSRLCHELGLKLGATRKIQLRHTGTTEFVNDRPWGKHTYDVESSQCSPVPGAFPYEIPGWLKPAEGKALAELAEGRSVLEIGSYCGLSTICMARTAEHVTALDYFDGRGTPNPRNTLDEFTANIKRYGVEDKVVACRPGGTLPRKSYKVVFIDGDHEEESVRADAELAMSVVDEDGFIVFHDYKAPCHPGVDAVVDELVSQGGKIVSLYENLAVVRPPAGIPLEV